jgi:hypothetical protein
MDSVPLFPRLWDIANRLESQHVLQRQEFKESVRKESFLAF